MIKATGVQAPDARLDSIHGPSEIYAQPVKDLFQENNLKESTIKKVLLKTYISYIWIVRWLISPSFTSCSKKFPQYQISVPRVGRSLTMNDGRTLCMCSSSPHAKRLENSMPVKGVAVTGRRSEASIMRCSTFRGFTFRKNFTQLDNELEISMKLRLMRELNID